MIEFIGRFKKSVLRGSVSPVGAVAVGLVFIGAFLSVSVHMGFLALFAAGAFGPGLLRELGLLVIPTALLAEPIVLSGRRPIALGDPHRASTFSSIHSE